MSEDGSAILRYSMCLYSMYLVTLDVLLRVKNVGWKLMKQKFSGYRASESENRLEIVEM